MTNHTNPKGSLGETKGDGLRQARDAHAELDRLAGDLRHAVLRVVWRQWRTLGAATSGSLPSRTAEEKSQHVDALIDPEALVLISLVLQRDERRLGDVLHDWAVLNSDLLSVQRMKNLGKDYSPPLQDDLTFRMSWFAGVAHDEGKDLRWRSLTHASAAHSTTKSHRDTLPPENQSLARVAGKHAPIHERGKMRVTRARLATDPTLLLRLRLGFGVGLKADLLGFLLTGVEEWATVRDVADATGYTVAAVRRAAEDLASARLIESLEGQPQGYRVLYSAWAPLLGLGPQPPRWGAWHERFVFAAAFLEWSLAVRDRPLSDYALGAHGRDLLEEHRRAFERDGIALWSMHSPVQDWAAFVSKSVHSLSTWMEEMA